MLYVNILYSSNKSQPIITSFAYLIKLSTQSHRGNDLDKSYLLRNSNFAFFIMLLFVLEIQPVHTKIKNASCN